MSYRMERRCSSYFSICATLLIAASLVFVWPASAQVETVLHVFAGYPNEGSRPDAPLLQASDGNFYGTTFYGGPDDAGTIYRITPSGSITTLRSFDVSVPNGVSPFAGLIQADNGNLYGTTLYGGTTALDGENDYLGWGTVFTITLSGTLTTLHSFGDGSVFNDGTLPYGAVVEAGNGILYGTASGGGSNGEGTVYAMTKSGDLTSLHSFGDGSTANDGNCPQSSLTPTAGGDLFGTTEFGGVTTNCGAIFRLAPSGAVSILHSFSAGTDGVDPEAAMILAKDGNFYGTTYYGGSVNGGSVFKISPSGVETVLHSFGDKSVKNDGIKPFAGLLQASDGNLYGTTYAGGSAGAGTIFKITTSGVLTILHSFGDGSVSHDGSGPMASLIQAKDGSLYGTTSSGGLASGGGAGTVFKLYVVGLSKPEYTVTASSGPGGSIAPSGSVTAYQGANQEFAAKPDIGYQVYRWILDGKLAQTGGADFTIDAVQSNHTVSVSFAPIVYTITASSGADGSITPSGAVTVNATTSKEFTAKPAANYRVYRWSLDGGVVQIGGATYTLSNVLANHTLSVSFTPIQYTVTASANPDGSIAPSGAVAVDAGANAEFEAKPNAGFGIVRWVLDGSVVQIGGATYTLDDIESNHTLTASFAVEYTVTAVAGVDGAVSPSGAVKVLSSTSQIFAATPSSDYQVSEWALDGKLAQTGGATYTLSDVQANHTVAVFFKSGSPIPLLTSISPTSAVAGTPRFTITVNGSSFVARSVVHWNNTALPTTYVSADKLTALVPATLVTSAGTASVAVFTSAPGGGTSVAVRFTIEK